MKYKIEIENIEIVDEIEKYWTNDDYVKLLGKFDYPDGSEADKDSLKDLLFMAISDFEPREAAAIVLEYKLSEQLSDGQIQQISSDMLIDKVCEEYREIGLHSTLFHINQLLFKAYNGKFPNAKATIINCKISPLESETNDLLSKENVLKLFANGLSDSNIINRLFDQAMHFNATFPEAEDILWDLESTDNLNFKITTSEYWLGKEDVLSSEFEGVLEEVKEEV
ncbi:hypothetical protein [Flavobacterium sp.]|uniref:hypothetical protein n=1 Tax=Flavobacterium sp. TaxID=239 RepID=UPI00286C6F3A|nr:hypothetical protein [Flavobacterium sp.]